MDAVLRVREKNNETQRKTKTRTISFSLNKMNTTFFKKTNSMIYVFQFFSHLTGKKSVFFSTVVCQFKKKNIFNILHICFLVKIVEEFKKLLRSLKVRG